ncbi:MAG: hypothetical protein WD557_19440 [Dehalococcoidia bacterium]
MPTDEDILALVREAFAVPRPEHFTNHPGCSECAEQNETLQAHDLDTISSKEIGSPAWDPITMCTNEAFQYWMPALARLTLEPDDDYFGWYGDSLMSQLEWDGPRNARWESCTPVQRQAVAALLEHVFATQSQRICPDDLDRVARVTAIRSDAGQSHDQSRD